MIARRGLGLSLASAWPAGAQTRMPCGPGVPIVLEGTGAPAGSITVFGQVFRPGEIPAGAGLAAALADGRPLLAQIDVKNRHPDGSARMAVVALACPALAQAARVRSTCRAMMAGCCIIQRRWFSSASSRSASARPGKAGAWASTGVSTTRASSRSPAALSAKARR